MNTRKAIKKYKTLSCTSPNYLKIQFTFTSDIHSDHLMKPNCIYRNQELSCLGTHLYFLGLQFGTVFPIVYVIHRTLTYLSSDI